MLMAIGYNLQPIIALFQQVQQHCVEMEHIVSAEVEEEPVHIMGA